jgi:hypothetical protein
MLSLPNDGRYPALELTPQQRRQVTLEALILQVVTLSRQNPVLMILEDAHWTDPTSLDPDPGVNLRDAFLRTLAADLRRRCDRGGAVGDGDVHRAAIAARAAVVPKARVISGLG